MRGLEKYSTEIAHWQDHHDHHCTKWNAEIQVFSSVPCTSDVARYIYHSLSFKFDPLA